MHEYKAPLTDMQFVLRELVDHDRCPVAGVRGGVARALRGGARGSGQIRGRRALAAQSARRSGGRSLARYRGEHGGRMEARPTSSSYPGAGMRLSCPREFGGQNLPRALSALVEEMWNGANMAFTLCPMLTRGAIEAIELNGSERQKRGLSAEDGRRANGRGTMNLTEPQAGSDLAAVRTRAEPLGGGRYKIEGQKIFITYGEHDLTENIVHMVLARTPSAPEGVRGMSLFLVPKFMVNPDGTLGERNDVRCASVEHKLGIHGSPTCVLALWTKRRRHRRARRRGESRARVHVRHDECRALCRGRRGRGPVGARIPERACIRERAHSGHGAGEKDRVPIVRHPDVRRMLMLMKSKTEAMRALASVGACRWTRRACIPMPSSGRGIRRSRT